MKGSLSLGAGLRVGGIQSQHVVCCGVSCMHAAKTKSALWIREHGLPLDTPHIQCARLQDMSASNQAYIVHDHAFTIRGGDWLRPNSVARPPFGDINIRNPAISRRIRE